MAVCLHTFKTFVVKFYKKTVAKYNINGLTFLRMFLKTLRVLKYQFFWNRLERTVVTVSP